MAKFVIKKDRPWFKSSKWKFIWQTRRLL